MKSAIFLAAALFALPAPAEFDILVANGTLHDGSGGPARRADLGIRGERIVAVGRLSREKAARVVDASRMVVCPGFIDLHTHSDNPILEEATRSNLNYLLQGCTLVVTGNCGGGHVDVGGYLARVDASGAGTHVAHLIPLGSVRGQVVGPANRAPTAEELERMRSHVERGMADGAFGATTGLIYEPGAFAKTEEIIELAKVVARHGGIYASHIRNESDRLVEAVQEAIEIGRAAGCPAHISHFKAGGRENWGKRLQEAAAAIEAAREKGMRVTADQYPYVASSTGLAANLLPAELREGGRVKLVERLGEPAVVAEIRKRIESRSPDRIMIASFTRDPTYNGKTLAQIAEKEGRAPLEVALDILKRGGASGIFFGMSEDDVRWAMRKKWVATASDGSARAPGNAHPHPRSFGTFARKIGYYAIELGILPLEQAIHSASGLPAQVLGLKDRGLLRQGYFADLAVFDPKRFRDRATYEKPDIYAEGVRYLWVNGTLAIEGGQYTGKLAGKALRHSLKEAAARTLLAA